MHALNKKNTQNKTSLLQMGGFYMADRVAVFSSNEGRPFGA